MFVTCKWIITVLLLGCMTIQHVDAQACVSQPCLGGETCVEENGGATFHCECPPLDPNPDCISRECTNRLLYACTGGIFSPTPTTAGSLYFVNATTADVTLIGSLSTMFACSGLSERPLDGQLFGAGIQSNTVPALFTISKTTGVAVSVGAMNPSSADPSCGGQFTDIKFRPSDGVLFGISQGPPQDCLFQINPATAALTFIGNLGLPTVSIQVGGAMFFSENGTILYFASQQNLTIVSTTTGVATVIATLSGGTFSSCSSQDMLVGGTRLHENGPQFQQSTVYVIDDCNTGVTNLLTLNEATGNLTTVGLLSGSPGFFNGISEVRAGNNCQNNGTCNFNASFGCTCAAGWTGIFCTINIDECSSQPCHNGGSCTDLVDGFTCTCLGGFSGSLCQTNINECASIPCQFGGTCTDGINSYSCTCFPGFSGAFCQTMINNCQSTPCQNGGTCNFLVNGYTCGCAAGYSGVFCQTEIDECGSMPCLNGGSCTDFVNGYNCTCPTGAFGTHCQSLFDACSSLPCQNGGNCSDILGGYTCACAPGFSGSLCQTEINFCDSQPCFGPGSICTPFLNGFNCTCGPLLSGPTCQTVHFDSCYLAPVAINSITGGATVYRHHVETGIVQLWYDSSITGFTWFSADYCNGKLWVSGGSPAQGSNLWILSQTDGSILQNISITPSPGCTDTTVGNTLQSISCHPTNGLLYGFYGVSSVTSNCLIAINTTTLTAHPVANITGPLPGNNVQMEFDSTTGILYVLRPTTFALYTLSLETGNTTLVGLVTLNNPCFNNILLRAGLDYDITQSLMSIDFQCASGSARFFTTLNLTLPGFNLPLQNLTLSPIPSGSVSLSGYTNAVNRTRELCNFHGTCIDTPLIDNNFTCSCDTGFSGPLCTIPPNACDSTPCHNGATCAPIETSFTCLCPLGFTGTLCETNVNECASVPCRNGATCVDAINGYSCTCQAGFSGVLCQTEIDECASAPCQFGGTCTDLVNGFNCTCPVGISGSTCETMLNVCGSFPCQNGGNCTEIFLAAVGFTCTCPPGFSGTVCQSEIDECASQPCQNGGTCVDLLDGYICECPSQLAPNATNLGAARSFAVLGSSTVTNTGFTVVTGDLGLSPGTSVTGFPPGIVVGVQHITDAVAAQAQVDATTAYNDLASRTSTTIPVELGGTTQLPGAYDSGTFQITTTLILNGGGDPNAVFIFKAGTTLITAGSSLVVLTNGTQACNVFWQVGSSATLGASSVFQGTIIALASITATTSSIVNGRLIARSGAVTLDTNPVARPVCATIGFLGANCETELDLCASFPCANGGSCSNQSSLGFNCTCLPGFTGPLCQTEVDECASQPCQNCGNCTDVVNGYTCLCIPGTTGVNCEKVMDVCASQPCENGGTCMVSPFNCTVLPSAPLFTCLCPSGFTGVDCGTVVCPNVTVCANVTCPPSFNTTIFVNQTEIVFLNTTCPEFNVTCNTTTPANFTCPEFNVTTCVNVTCPPSVNTTIFVNQTVFLNTTCPICFNETVFVNQTVFVNTTCPVVNVTCPTIVNTTCPICFNETVFVNQTVFVNTTCPVVNVTCPANTTVFINSTCPVVNATCLNQTIFVDRTVFLNITCPTVNSTIVVVNATCPTCNCTAPPPPPCPTVNECATSNGGCDSLTTCFDTLCNRTCGGCPPGYKGNGLTGCTDINECQANNGGCRHYCINLPGSHFCSDCPAGTFPDGYDDCCHVRCTDINECRTLNGGCDPRVTCHNFNGGYECGACPIGFFGTGRNCTAIDCELTGCLHNGTCVGIFNPQLNRTINSCDCVPPYTGVLCELVGGNIQSAAIWPNVVYGGVAGLAVGALVAGLAVRAMSAQSAAAAAAAANTDTTPVGAENPHDSDEDEEKRMAPISPNLPTLPPLSSAVVAGRPPISPLPSIGPLSSLSPVGPTTSLAATSRPSPIIPPTNRAPSRSPSPAPARPAVSPSTRAASTVARAPMPALGPVSHSIAPLPVLYSVSPSSTPARSDLPSLTARQPVSPGVPILSARHPSVSRSPSPGPANVQMSSVRPKVTSPAPHGVRTRSASPAAPDLPAPVTLSVRRSSRA